MRPSKLQGEKRYGRGGRCSGSEANAAAGDGAIGGAATPVCGASDNVTAAMAGEWQAAQAWQALLQSSPSLPPRAGGTTPAAGSRSRQQPYGVVAAPNACTAKQARSASKSILPARTTR